MTREALRAGEITEDTVAAAMITSRGDLFLTAAYLGCTAREVDLYIRASDVLQGLAASIGTVKQSAAYDKLSQEQFASELDQMTRAYRVEAMQEIHALAMVDISSNAAMMEVKLKAAVQLRGANTERSVNNEQAMVLAELNDLYRANAPRIKSVRAVQIEYDTGSGQP